MNGINGINGINGMDFIAPMERLKGIGFPTGSSLSDTQAITEGAAPFRSIFQNAIDTVKQTEQQTAIDSERLATGDIEDLHSLGIDSTKAYLSVRLLVEMRNKALDSYNELMRTNV